MVLVHKWQLFRLFFLGNIGQENILYDILEGKIAFLGYKNKKLKKWKNGPFCKGVNPWFKSKNFNFSNFLFQAIQARKISYTIFQKEKSPFQAKKRRSSKSRKIDIFPKVLETQWPFFLLFFLGNIEKENILNDILEQKTTFQDIKTRSSKSRKIDIFPKGLTHGFCPKMAIFQFFFFRQYKPGKYPQRYSRTKKRLSRLKKPEVQKVEKLTFLKRG